jgi:4-hydroxyphenylacetate decarboxylase large subunit
MARMLQDVLKEAGMPLENSTGSADVTEREIRRKPGQRAEKLMALYFQTLSSTHNEFAYWYSRSYFEHDSEVPVVRRAMALREAFSHLTPVIYPGELIVMQRAAYYRGSFPMPWLSESYYMAKEDELYQEALKRGSTSVDEHSKFGTGGGNVTKGFGKVVSIAGKFGMRQEEVPALLKLARMWHEKSVEDLAYRYEKMVPGYDVKEKIMRNIICMFDSGYTLPQGREVINYYYPLQYGFDGIMEMARQKKDETAGRATGDGMVGMNRLYNYEAVILVLQGIASWILNYVREARRLEAIEKEPEGKSDYGNLAERLEWIAHKPPRNFRDAIQLCWIIHLAVLNEDAISGLSPGRLGQVLYPYYKEDMDAGRITKDEAMELLECQRVKFTSIDCFASTGVVGGVLSGNTFNNLSLGGLDREGRAAANELEMLIMEAGITCATPQPTLSILYDEKMPEEFLLKAVECVKTGTGYPAFMNNRVAMDFLLDHYGPEGMTVQEARAWAIGGCLETSPCSWLPLSLNGRTHWIPGGSGQPTSVGVHFISLPKILELVIHDGIDGRTGERVFESHGLDLESYDEIWTAFRGYFRKTVDLLARCNNIQHDIWRKNNMAIFNSLLKPDCLDKGHLINELGYRYNATYNIETTGTINLVNSLAALRKIVYDDRAASIEEMKEALRGNFGFRSAHEINSFSIIDQVKHEGGDKFDRIHHLCLAAPKYGNDEPYVDSILHEWEEWFTGMCGDNESLYGKPLYACQISVSTHGAMGSATTATPDGRLNGTTFADASLSAYPGTDRKGPYALFTSATVWEHSRSQNSQLNLKIHPTVIAGTAGARKLLELTRAYLRRGGFHIQYNIVDSRILRDAQVNPGNYRELMVRVAGFTQYWVEIGKSIQDEIIARTEYGDV